MAERLNRQYRRELQKQERMRQKRAERAAAKRQRVRTRWRERRQQASAQFSFRAWLLRPYKPVDMLLLFFVLWGLRYWAMRVAGGEAAPAPLLSQALLVAQATFAVVAVLYLAFIARDGFHWSGPPGYQLPPSVVWGGGVLVGVVVYALGRIFTQLLMATLPAGTSPEEMGLVSPILWSGLMDMDPILAIAWWVIFVVVIPLGDEVYYRRILGRIFTQAGRMTEGWIIVSIALLYTLGSGGVFPLPAAAAGGLILTFVWMRTQAMGIVILAHAVQAGIMVFTG